MAIKEGQVWRADYTYGDKMGSTVVVATDMKQAQQILWREMPSVTLVSFYQIGGVRGVVFEGK